MLSVKFQHQLNFPAKSIEDHKSFEKYQRMAGSIEQRRLMEANNTGAEVRRLHIVYFLSRNSLIEHPHLIRVHHVSRNGVKLRDIKRWLGELRGKDMPESFSWSYKRRYKTGYVWQDLLDDDLITPISDNEYVLKGSEISSTSADIEFSKVSMQKEQSFLEEQTQNQKSTSRYENQSNSSEILKHVLTKSSSEIEEEFPTFGSETSTLTDDSGKLEVAKNISDKIKPQKQDRKPSMHEKIENLSSFNSTVMSKKNKIKKNNKIQIDEKISTPEASSNTSSVEPNFSKSKIYSNGASNNIFRNMITCGAVDTNDSTMMKINKHNRPFFNMCSGDQKNVHSVDICKRDNKFGGSRGISTTPWNQQQWSDSRKGCDGLKDSRKNRNETRDQRVSCAAAYKPVNGPNCSQCGKPFKPEKLHAHMSSCKGMKALAKGANTAISGTASEKTANRSSTGSHSENSVSRYLLTQ